jgi:nitrite reductase/ring-hydroxylating ferredoxin subunit/uncharacterized membrane protein
MIIPFPIAFLTGSLVADLAAYLSGNGEFYRVAYWLQIAGVVMALVAAIPGFVDFLFTVPPKSSGKKRAAQHGIINVIVVAVFAFNWFYRQKGDASYQLIIAIDVVGTVLLVISGWLGGTLAYRNQIGVDHRYAYAGKWKEEYTQKNGRILVAKKDELKPNQMKLLHVDGQRIVLARNENNYSAFEDRCTHRGASLADGSLICGVVQCPWHGSQFDVRNGDVKAGPAKERIKTYSISETDGNIYLELERESELVSGTQPKTINQKP